MGAAVRSPRHRICLTSAAARRGGDSKFILRRILYRHVSAHREYVTGGWPMIGKLLKDGQGAVLDVKSKLDRAQRPKEIDLWRL